MATSSGRQPKPKGAAAELLREINAAKAERDRKKLTKEQQENAALERYAKAVGAAVDAQAAAAKKIERLQAQLDELREEAAKAASKYEPEQGAALAELQKLGQSADEIAALVKLSAKRVRALIKRADGTTEPTPTGKSAATAAASEDTAATATPVSKTATDDTTVATDAAASAEEGATKVTAVSS